MEDLDNGGHLQQHNGVEVLNGWKVDRTSMYGPNPARRGKATSNGTVPAKFNGSHRNGKARNKVLTDHDERIVVKRSKSSGKNAKLAKTEGRVTRRKCFRNGEGHSHLAATSNARVGAPVRENRFDKSYFLQLLEHNWGHITYTCADYGITQAGLSWHRAKDPSFNQAVLTIHEMGRRGFTEGIREAVGVEFGQSIGIFMNEVMTAITSEQISWNDKIKALELIGKITGNINTGTSGSNIQINQAFNPDAMKDTTIRVIDVENNRVVRKEGRQAVQDMKDIVDAEIVEEGE